MSDVTKCSFWGFFGQKEADNALSKRLAEVNEELHKSQARNNALQKDLNTTTQVLRTEEAKTAELNSRLKEQDANQADAMNSLTAKLQEATARISELQKMFSDVENQLKDSQVIQMQKDKEIQVCTGHGFFTLLIAGHMYVACVECFVRISDYCNLQFGLDVRVLLFYGVVYEPISETNG